MIIYLDFDGTVVEHQYPKMGRCNFGCFEVMKKLQDAGHEIILNTYRADIGDGTLEEALSLINDRCNVYIKDRSQRDTFDLLPITATERKIYPAPWHLEQARQTQTLFIDDIAHGMPLKPAVMTKGRMVDWDEVDKQLEQNGFYQTI